MNSLKSQFNISIDVVLPLLPRLVRRCLYIGMARLETETNENLWNMDWLEKLKHKNKTISNRSNFLFQTRKIPHSFQSIQIIKLLEMIINHIRVKRSMPSKLSLSLYLVNHIAMDPTAYH